jgi:hypothetical protein
MNMSSESFWELFAETGDITYYLLYASADTGSAPETGERRPEPAM